MRVLVIDDDPAFLLSACTALKAAGVECATAQGAEAGLVMLSERTHGAFDLVVLGVHRHGRSSWDVLMEVRELADEVPVLCLTTHPPGDQDGHALELGADECVVKPVSGSELSERVRAVLQHRRSLPTIACGDLCIDLSQRRVERAGAPIHLAPREYDLLLALVRADGKTLPREDLVRGVWGPRFKSGANAVEVHLGRLRKKVDQHGCPLIEAVFGAGYRIVHPPRRPS